MARRGVQQHKIVIRAIEVDNDRGGTVARFSGKDVLSGVGAAGDTSEDARKRIMSYYRLFPDKLPVKSRPGLTEP